MLNIFFLSFFSSGFIYSSLRSILYNVLGTFLYDRGLIWGIITIRAQSKLSLWFLETKQAEIVLARIYNLDLGGKGLK